MRELNYRTETAHVRVGSNSSKGSKQADSLRNENRLKLGKRKIHYAVVGGRNAYGTSRKFELTVCEASLQFVPPPSTPIAIGTIPKATATAPQIKSFVFSVPIFFGTQASLNKRRYSNDVVKRSATRR